MSRAVVSTVVAAAVVLAGCSGGGRASPYGDAPACALLARLARTGQTVAKADVSDPDAFDTTMRTAVSQYVETATELRAAVPEHLRPDVERMITAVKAQRFADAARDRTAIDTYARSTCKTET